MPDRLLEVIAPTRLGVRFRWVLGSSWVSNLGDGLALAAGPLLVASQTHEPFLVALAAIVQWMPNLVFGLIAGALSDRLDRRAIMIWLNLTRVAVLGVLVMTISTGTVSVPLVLGSLFMLATAEVFVDNTAGTVLPMIVARDDLAVANSRLQVGFITLNKLAGPPIGAALFAAGAAWPFAGQACLLGLAVVLLGRVVLPAYDLEPGEPTRVRHDIVEGLAWVRHHAAMRTLVLTVFIFNVTLGAAFSVLVLYATERLGMSAVQFGLLTTGSAAGGLIATLAYGRITAHVSLSDLMKIGLVVETLTHLALALTTVPWVAMAIFFLFGAHSYVWGTTSTTVRQRAVPTRLQGRVGSVEMVGVCGGMVLGAGLGGLIATQWGLTAPFWFAFGGSALFVVGIWPQLRHIAHADRESAPLDQVP